MEATSENNVHPPSNICMICCRHISYHPAIIILFWSSSKIHLKPLVHLALITNQDSEGGHWFTVLQGSHKEIWKYQDILHSFLSNGLPSENHLHPPSIVYIIWRHHIFYHPTSIKQTCMAWHRVIFFKGRVSVMLWPQKIT